MKHLLLLLSLLGGSFLFSQPLPISNVDISPERCGRDDGSIMITHGGTAPFQYFLNAISIAGPTASGLDQGMYVFRVVDAIGRSKDTTVTVPEISAPVLALLNTTDATCRDGGTAEIVSSDPTATVTWNSVPQQSGFILSGVPAGTYTATVVDSVNCSSSLQVVINGIPPPDLGFSSTADTCGAGDGTATVSITGNGTAPFTYRWNNNETTATISNLAAGSYEVEVFDANGCRATGRVTVDLFSNLQVTAAITRTSCFGGNDGRIAVTVTGGNGQYSYEWSPNVGNEAVIENLDPGNYTVTVTDVQGQSGACIAIETFTVVQPPEIRINAQVQDASGCRQPDAVTWVEPQFTQGPIVVTWDTLFPQRGNFIPIVGDTAKGLLPGLYQVRIVDSAGCTASSRVVVPNRDNIGLTVEILQEDICGKSEGVVNAIVTGGVRPIRYNWFTFPAQAVNDPFARGLPAGTFNVVVSDDNGCLAQQGFTVPGNDPLAFDTSITTPSYCELNNGTARVQFVGGEEPYSFNWTSSPVQTDALATGLDGGFYRVIIRDVNNCRDTVSVFVRDSAGFELSLTGTDETCFRANDGTARAIAVGASGGVNFRWNTDPVSFGSQQRGLAPGNYQVIATDSEGCTRSDVIKIGDAQPLLADFRFFPDTMMPVLLGEAEFQFLEQSTGAAGFFWKFGDGETSVEANPVHVYNDTGRFDVTLIVINESGVCQDSLTVGSFIVRDRPAIWVPSAFSPNQDAFNDRLTFATLNLQSFDMQIFNRWGRVVFQANDPNSFWDGNSPSGAAPEGVYVYLLKAIGPDGERIEQRGTITLIR